MPASASITWTRPVSAMAGDVAQIAARLMIAVERHMTMVAARILSWVRANHPWQNQTGAAEASFTVQALNGGMTILLMHGVFYGIYLEYKHGGRWGVIPAAIEAGIPMVIQGLQAALAEAIGG